MSYPKALRGDDELTEVRPKRMELQTSKITPTNPLSFADKSAQAVGPSRGFEPPPQAMELPSWEAPISPANHADFPYPSKGIGPPQAVLEHPMKAKGYMKHAEKIKREMEDMQVCTYLCLRIVTRVVVIDFSSISYLNYGIIIVCIPEGQIQ